MYCQSYLKSDPENVQQPSYITSTFIVIITIIYLWSKFQKWNVTLNHVKIKSEKKTQFQSQMYHKKI